MTVPEVKRRRRIARDTCLGVYVSMANTCCFVTIRNTAKLGRNMHEHANYRKRQRKVNFRTFELVWCAANAISLLSVETNMLVSRNAGHDGSDVHTYL